MSKYLYSALLLVLLFVAGPALAQSTVYAQLQGSPLNLANWSLAGAAYVGDTQGDTEPGTNNELILTNPVNTTSGAAFFRNPLNLAECQRWTAEFDFRMWEGTAADGIAFCFLANPPSGFVTGGGLGIPSRPRGIMVALDTWLNCPGTTAVPKVEIRFEEGTRDYSECPTPAQPTSATLPLRSSTYQRCRITYQNGNITVFINGAEVLTGQFQVSFAGYFGFTAATGGSTDRHSIKNFTMFTDPVVTQPANAGPDVTACPGQAVQLGVAPRPGEQYTYSWQPTTGLDNPNIANPRVTVRNTSRQPLRLSYFVTKDTLRQGGGTNLCARVDEVVVTVPGLGADAGPNVTVCGGQRYQNANFRGFDGYRYQWTALGNAPLTALSSATVASPVFTLPATGLAAQTLRYVQTAINLAANCQDADTLEIAYVPALPPGIKSFRLCSGERQALGYPALPGFTATWAPAEGLTGTNVPNPTFTGLNVTEADSVQRRYILTAVSPSCTLRDTVVITVLRAVVANAGPDLRLCADSTARLGAAPVAGLTYQWAPATHLSDARAANPTFRLPSPPAQAQTLTYILTVNNALGRCARRDTVQVFVAPNNLPRTGRRTFRLCAGQRQQIGINTVFGQGFNWSLTDHIDPRMPLTTFRAPAITTDSLQLRYVLTITNGACTVRDTSDITVLRLPRANLGPDLVACSGQPLALGFAPEAGVEYTWAPATGLSRANVSDPTFLLVNNTILPNQLRYVLTARNPATGCTATDTLQVTVQRNPFFRALRGRVRVCSGQSQQIGPIPTPGYRYQWSPSENLSNPAIANPVFRGNNTTADSLELRYIVTVTDSLAPPGSRGCVYRDTTTIVLYRLVTANAGPDRALCSNDTSRLGQPPVRGISYAWTALGTSPLAALSALDVANPVFRLRNTTNAALVASYVLTARNAFGCLARDTVQVRVVAGELPTGGRRTVRLCAGEERAIGQPANPLFRYRWSPSSGLSSDTLASPTVRAVNPTADSLLTRYVLTISNGPCQVRDTTDVVAYRLPAANAGPDRTLCSNDTARLGQPPVANVTYAWTALGNAPLAAFSATNLANPVFRLRNTTNAALVASYVLTARNSLGCLARDTVQVRVVAGELPTGGRRTVRLCAGEERAIGQAANPLFRYRWAPAAGLSSDTVASPTVRTVNPTADSLLTRYVLTISNGPCQVRDTTDVVAYRLPAANAGPDRTLCSGETVDLGAAPSPGLTYQWLALAGASLADLSAANVANPRFSLTNLTGANATRGYVVRVRNAAGCQGQDTVLLTVTARVETAGLAIQGPASVCAQAPASYTLNRPSGNRYQWEVRGGQLASGQGTASVRVNWGGDGPGQLTVTETTANGCTGTPVTLAVTINPLPRPRLVRADSVVCRNDLRGKVYQATGLAGSRFGWSLSGGRIVATTPDSTQITVDWDTLSFPKQLAVTERSAAGCAAAAPLRVRIELDGTAISLRAVGTQLADERNVEVRFRIANAPTLAQTFTVERRPTGQGNFQAVGTVQATDTLFTDRGQDTDANSFEYRIRRTQQTGACPTVEPAPHASVRLQASALPGNGVALNWSSYQGWPRLARYEIWRRADGGANTLLGQVGGNTLTNNVLDSRAGFTQCFRVRAIEAGTGRESWSNEVCLGFDFPLVVPNVITPNGDGRNDRFVVPNLELYQQPILEVFNRYGQRVHESAGYRNDWDGSDLPTGTYFYVLRAQRPGQETRLEFKGWVQVLR